MAKPASSPTFNIPNIAFQELPPRELGVVGNVVSWVRNPESATIVKVLKYTLAFFTSILLIMSLIGIPVLILGIKESIKQSEEEQYRLNFAENKTIAEDNLELSYTQGLDTGLALMGLEDAARNEKIIQAVEQLDPVLTGPFHSPQGKIQVGNFLRHMAHNKDAQLFQNLGIVPAFHVTDSNEDQVQQLQAQLFKVNQSLNNAQATSKFHETQATQLRGHNEQLDKANKELTKFNKEFARNEEAYITEAKQLKAANNQLSAQLTKLQNAPAPVTPKQQSTQATTTSSAPSTSPKQAEKPIALTPNQAATQQQSTQTATTTVDSITTSSTQTMDDALNRLSLELKMAEQQTPASTSSKQEVVENPNAKQIGDLQALIRGLKDENDKLKNTPNSKVKIGSNNQQIGTYQSQISELKKMNK